MRHTLEVERPTVTIGSNNKVKIKKTCMRTYEVYLKSPLCRCSKIWEMLTYDVQRVTKKVKFKNLIKQMCRLT